MTSLLTDAIRDLIGREVTYTAPEELGRASIRYFARAIGDDNPVYTDDAAARAAGHDGVVAPPTLIFESNQYADLPRDAHGFAGHGWDIEIPNSRQVRGGNRYELVRPVLATDRLTVTWTLVDAAERLTGSGQAMLVLTARARYTDAAGELVATNEETLIYVARG